MRLKRLYLKGYANIYNAMTRREINIDFSNCHNRVVVIRSENGSGKSSIINELHPFFSSSNVWMSDTDIQKTIEFYLDDNTELYITYHGWKAVNTRSRPSKCYIQRVLPDRSVVELNPSGNINSGKDIISDLLDISDDYMNLASISANSTGIGAMKPAERKRFIALIVNSIAPFAKMYKLLSTKYVVVKSMITTLSAKIDQLGNIEVIQANMDKAITELAILENKRLELIKTQADIKAKMELLSNGGSPIERYNSLLNQSIAISTRIQDTASDVINFNELELREKEKEQIQIQTKIDTIEKILSNIIEQETQLRSQIEEDKIRLDSLSSKQILEDSVNRLEKAEEELSIYISRFESLGFYEYSSINENEYSIAIDMLAKFNNMIEFLASQYSREELTEAVKYISTTPELVDCNTIISSLQSKLDTVKEQIIEQNTLKNQSQAYEEIPIDCQHHHDCPFIITIVKAQESKMIDSKFKELLDYRDELVRLIYDTQEKLQRQDRLMSCIYQVRELVNSISSMSRLILKFPNTQKVKDIEHIIDCITNSTTLDIDISQYKEYTNYITLISALKKDINSYKDKIQQMTNSSQESLLIKNRLGEKTNNLKLVSEQKAAYLAEINELNNKKLDIESFISTGIQNQSLRLQYEEDVRLLDNISSQLESLTKDSKLYKTLESSYIKITNELNNLNTSNIPELKNIVEQSKYQMLLYEQYKQEYATYSNLFNKIEMVKKYSSINGIQAEIMDYTMNQILSMVNQLTTMIFGGRFMLNKFDITATDFMISFIDKELGIIRPDISMMSASQLGQLSMIISFVLLHNASKKFNIIRLDEVDNNLDNDNRLRFFDLVYTITQILNFHQVVLISHNTELDLTNCDLIITRLQNQEAYRALLNSGANIIADFNM